MTTEKKTYNFDEKNIKVQLCLRNVLMAMQFTTGIMPRLADEQMGLKSSTVSVGWLVQQDIVSMIKVGSFSQNHANLLTRMSKLLSVSCKNTDGK